MAQRGMSTHQKKLQQKAEALAEKQKKPPIVQAHGSDTAPVIFFDGAVAYGLNGTTARIELATTCNIPVSVDGKSDVRQRVLVTCHLRGSLDAMAQLADTIEKCLTMGALPTPPAEEKKNVQPEPVHDRTAAEPGRPAS
jgi:hypothetical protein